MLVGFEAARSALTRLYKTAGRSFGEIRHLFGAKSINQSGCHDPPTMRALTLATHDRPNENQPNPKLSHSVDPHAARGAFRGSTVDSWVGSGPVSSEKHRLLETYRHGRADLA